MHRNEEITGIILAGGKSTRMGIDKSNLLFRGKRLIEYPYELMREKCQKIIISTNTSSLKLPGVSYVPDNYKDIGPLAGLEAGLRLSDTRWNFVLPCDMPFVNSELFSVMQDELDGYDYIVPQTADGKVTPLAGFFNRNILNVIVQQIKSGDYKAGNLLKRLKVKYFHTTNNLVTVNFNTLNDLEPFLDK